MKQEDKELLLRYLSMALPYKIKVCLYEKETCILLGIDGYEVYLDVDSDSFRMESIKPYLRPMSSMTEEETKDYRKTQITKWVKSVDCTNGGYYEHRDTLKTFDWLLAHHFDYRGLIPIDLAVEAPEGMYNS